MIGWPKARVGPNEYHSVGTPSIQEGTLMHEFGHNLGLGHGGGDYVNNKPNYFSIMNYELQLPIKVDNRPLDYSQCSVSTINESKLVERNGIGQSCPPELLMFIDCPPYISSLVSAGWPIDFTGDGDTDDANVTADLNCDNETTVLNGYDDWAHIRYITSPGNEGLGLRGTSAATSETPSTEMGLNLTEIYNGSLLGEQFNEPTFEDIKQQAGKKVDALAIAINKTEEATPPESVPESITGGLAGTSLNGMPQMVEQGNVNKSSVNDTYARVLGTENASSLTNDTSLQKNSTKGLILSDNIDGAINSTEGVLSTMDSAIGGSSHDDLLTKPNDQIKIGSLVGSTIESFKSISCTYSDCSAVNQTGNSTAN